MINRKGLSSLDNKSNQNKDNQKVKTNPITVGRVTDIILNEDFPNIKQYGGSKALGTIFWKSQTLETEVVGTAQPFFPQISSYPLVN